MSDLFLDIDFEQLSIKMQEVFTVPLSIDMGIIDMQSDVELKARAQEKDFWALVSRENYPLIVPCTLWVKAVFGSTYLM